MDTVTSSFSPQQQIIIPGAPSAQGLAGLPDTVAVSMLDRKSSDFTVYNYAWDLMYWLYVGGCEVEAVAEQFLKKRSKEMPDLYQSRIERFFYSGHAGNAVDWYLSALFETPAEVETKREDDAANKNAAKAPAAPPTPQAPAAPPMLGQPPQPPIDITKPVVPQVPTVPTTMTPGEADEFYNDFEENCDRAGTPLLEVFREFFRNLIVFGRAICLVDLPSLGDREEPKSLKEQKDAGLLDPYLVNYDPRQMINYEKDGNGKLSWVIFKNRMAVTPTPFEKTRYFDRWYYYDQKQYAVYEREVPEGEATQPTGAPDKEEAKKTAQGPHALTDLGVVPCLYIEIPRGLWLMNRAYGTAKALINTENAYEWALFMSCLAMPVVCTDADFVPTLSEAGFIKLPAGATYTWSEPEGKSFEQLARRVVDLKEDVFRAFYLVSQARSTSATASAQSGVSKQQDMTAPAKILNLYGDIMRAMIQATYGYVSAARNDSFDWDVRGLNFPEGPPNAELDTLAAAQAIGVPSLTFEREIYKKAVVVVAPDMNPDTKAAIFTEIEQAPSSADRESATLAQRATMVMAQDAFPKGSV